jgi:hypothetical protein
LGDLFGRGRGRCLFAHAAFNQQPDQQDYDGNHSSNKSLFKPFPAALLTVRPLQTGRDLERVRRIHNIHSLFNVASMPNAKKRGETG